MTDHPVRWRSLAAVLLVYLLVLLFAWLGPGDTRQNRIMVTMIATIVAGTAALVWLNFFSGLPVRPRNRFTLGTFALVLLAIALFRIDGVTGDVRPIVRFRWADTGPGAIESSPIGVAIEVVPTPDDSPQFLGPHRDGTLTGPRLARDWEIDPPRQLWRREVGSGWGSFAVVGNLAVTQEQRGDREAVIAYHLRGGDVLWSTSYEARYDSTIAGIGPRATPAIADGRVFVTGGTGILLALDAATGEELWRHDLIVEHGARLPEWGKSSSPLVVDDTVVVSAGGPEASLVAYEAATGLLRWAAGSDASSYSSPTLVRLAGREQLLILNNGSFASHDPVTGEMLWEVPWPSQQPSVAQPLPVPGDGVIVSAGYGVGAKRFDVGPTGVETAWESIRLKSKFAHAVLHDGTIYGLDDGVLTAIDPASGERLWKRGRYGHGQLLLVDDLLLIQAESGEVVLVEPNPEELQELTRFTALEGKTWNVPTLVGNLLLVRNDYEAAAYELPLR
jgi:outer membrane protein assembly factor BamB